MYPLQLKAELINYLTGYNTVCVGVGIVIYRINIVYYTIASDSEGWSRSSAISS